jgi:hypothetical protein
MLFELYLGVQKRRQETLVNEFGQEEWHRHDPVEETREEITGERMVQAAIQKAPVVPLEGENGFMQIDQRVTRR